MKQYIPLFERGFIFNQNDKEAFILAKEPLSDEEISNPKLLDKDKKGIIRGAIVVKEVHSEHYIKYPYVYKIKVIKPFCKKKDITTTNIYYKLDKNKYSGLISYDDQTIEVIFVDQIISIVLIDQLSNYEPKSDNNITHKLSKKAYDIINQIITTEDSRIEINKIKPYLKEFDKFKNEESIIPIYRGMWWDTDSFYMDKVKKWKLEKNKIIKYSSENPISFSTNYIIAQNFALHGEYGEDTYASNILKDKKWLSNSIYGIFSYVPKLEDILFDTRLYSDYNQIRGDSYHEREIILMPGTYGLKCVETNYKIKELSFDTN